MAGLFVLLKVGAVFGLLYYLIDLIIRRHKLKKLMSWAPGPSGYPLLGNIREFFGLDQAGMLQVFTKFHKMYGNVIKISIGPDSVMSIADPELLHVLSSRGKDSHKSVEYTFLEKFIGRSLLTTRGEEWHRRRKLLNPCFHYEVLETFMTSINTHSQQFVDHLGKYADSKEPFNFLTEAKLFTLDVLMDTFMGIPSETEYNERSSYFQAVGKMREVVVTRSLSSFLRFDVFYNFSSLKKEEDKAVDIIKGFVRQVITARKEKRKNATASQHQEIGSKRKAMLDMLLDLEDSGNLTEDEDIENEVNTFIFAGHDTTSVALAYTVFLIGTHPDIQEKLYGEIVESMPDFEKTGLCQADLNKLGYLDRCVKESMRMYSPVPLIGKILQQPLLTEKGVIPNKINITHNIYQMHIDENIYPEPTVFNPDRFLPDAVSNRAAHSFTPFGSGVRICIGQKFALNEIKVFLCYLIKNYRVESSVQPKDLNIGFDIVLTPLNGVHIKLHPR